MVMSGLLNNNWKESSPLFFASLPADGFSTHYGWRTISYLFPFLQKINLRRVSITCWNGLTLAPLDSCVSRGDQLYSIRTWRLYLELISLLNGPKRRKILWARQSRSTLCTAASKSSWTKFLWGHSTRLSVETLGIDRRRSDWSWTKFRILFRWPQTRNSFCSTLLVKTHAAQVFVGFLEKLNKDTIGRNHNPIPFVL